MLFDDSFDGVLGFLDMVVLVVMLFVVVDLREMNWFLSNLDFLWGVLMRLRGFDNLFLCLGFLCLRLGTILRDIKIILKLSNAGDIFSMFLS